MSRAPANDNASFVDDAAEPEDVGLEELDYVLLAFDEALAAVGMDTSAPSATLPPQLGRKLAGAEKALFALERAWPRAARSETKEPEVSPDGKRRFGNYELIGEVARGGMGVIYRAKQAGLNRTVALKMILSGRFASSAEVKRFRSEAEAAARLEHSGIVPIYEIGEHDGRHFFSMAFIDGQSLSDRLTAGPLPLRLAAEMLVDIADAVEYAHGKGVVHRDLKPQNILLDAAGKPKVTDFGLAKRLDNKENLTSTGDVLGTPNYMSPEQAQGKTDAIGPHTDVYALGAILYVMLTGRPPFQAATLPETLRQVVEREPVSPALLNPEVSKDLETICLKCLQKDPGRRYASAGALADDLRRYLAGEPILARPIGRFERFVRYCRRNPRSAGLIGVSLAAVVLTVIGLGYRRESLRWRETADAQTKLVAEQKKVVEQQTELAKQHQELANLETGMRHFSRAGEIASLRKPGWTWEALVELAEAEKLAGNRLDLTRIHSLTAECAAAFDLRPIGVVAEGILATSVAFSPDGRQLAVAQHKGTPTSSIFLYDVESRERVATFSISTAASNAATLLGQVFKGNLNSKFQEGMSGVAFSPDSQRLAAGTRMGKVYLWDLQEPKKAPREWSVYEEKSVDRIRFAADSKQMFAGSTGLAWLVRTWRTDDGSSAVENIPQSSGDFDLSPDGKRFATLREGLQIRELPTLREKTDLAKVTAHSLAWDRQGRFLVTGDYGGLSVVQAADGGVTRRIELKDSANLHFNTPLIVSAKGVAITSAQDGWIRAIDLGRGEEVARLSSGGRSFAIMALSPDESRLAVASESSTQIFELRSAEFCDVAAHLARPVDKAVLSPDGERLSAVATSVVGSLVRRTEGLSAPVNDAAAAETWFIHDAEHPPQFRTLNEHHWEDVAISDDGKLVAVNSGLLGLSWRVNGVERFPQQFSPSQPLREIKAGAFEYPLPEQQARLVPDPQHAGERVANLPLTAENSVCVIRVPLPTGRRSDPLAIAVHLRCAPVGPNNVALTCELSGRNASPRAHIPNGDWQWQIADVIPADEQKIGNEVDLKLSVDPATASELWIDRILVYPVSKLEKHDGVIPLTDGPIAISPDGRTIYGVVGGVQLTAWDAETGELKSRHDNSAMNAIAGSGRLLALAVGAKRVVAGTASGHVMVFDPERFKSVEIYRGPGEDVTALALSADESLIAVGVDSGKLRVIAAATGKTVAEMSDHSGKIVGLAFDRAGAALWSGSRDGTIRRWDRGDDGVWKPALTLSDPRTPLNSLSLDRAGKQLVYVCEGETFVRRRRLDRLEALFRGANESLKP